MYFNTYLSVMALHYPHRVRDLLAYLSIITKAAHDYDGTPWLSYDVHFRTLAASMQLPSKLEPSRPVVVVTTF